MRPCTVKIGAVYGRLTVTGERQERRANGGRVFDCVCSCGASHVASAQTLSGGRAKSCGCLRRERGARMLTKHGLSRRPEFNVWQGMIQRCTDENHHAWSLYGGRGIRVCDRWLHDFPTFLADVGPRPSSAHSLDRYPDQNGNYEPGNVRWATSVEQGRNRRNNRLLTVAGRTMTVAEWAAQVGVNSQTIYERIKRGYSHEDAVQPHDPAVERMPPELRGTVAAKIRHDAKKESA